MKFLAGLDAFHQAGHLHDFEVGKRSFIGGHGSTPVLLVQGPPGTGKSYSTAFAVFARLQGAMQAKRPFRVFVSCKTHAATDVLLKNVLEVQEKLGQLRDTDAKLFRNAACPRRYGNVARRCLTVRKQISNQLADFDLCARLWSIILPGARQSPAPIAIPT